MLTTEALKSNFKILKDQLEELNDLTENDDPDLIDYCAYLQLALSSMMRIILRLEQQEKRES